MIRQLLCAALAFVAPLAAQEAGAPDSMRGHMMGPGMGQMMEGPMMGEMGPAMMMLMMSTPQHLLARKDALGLSGDQISRLTALRDGAKAARDAAMTEAQTHFKEMGQVASAAQPDTAALRTHFQAGHSAMGNAHWAMIAAAAQARAVLTDAQRAQLQAWADSMRARMQEHRRMMNPGRP